MREGVAAGGVLGKITKIGELRCRWIAAPHRGAIQRSGDPDALPKGTIKSSNEPSPPLGSTSHRGGARARGSLHAAEVFVRPCVRSPRTRTLKVDSAFSGASRRAQDAGSAHGTLSRRPPWRPKGAALLLRHAAQGQGRHRPGLTRSANSNYTVAPTCCPIRPVALRDSRAPHVPRPGPPQACIPAAVDIRRRSPSGEGLAGDIRSQLRDKNVRHAGIGARATASLSAFRDAETRDKPRAIIGEQIRPCCSPMPPGGELRLVGPRSPRAQSASQEFALKQHPLWHNRSTSWVAIP